MKTTLSNIEPFTSHFQCLSSTTFLAYSIYGTAPLVGAQRLGIPCSNVLTKEYSSDNQMHLNPTLLGVPNIYPMFPIQHSRIRSALRLGEARCERP